MYMVVRAHCSKGVKFPSGIEIEILHDPAILHGKKKKSSLHGRMKVSFRGIPPSLINQGFRVVLTTLSFRGLW